MNGLVLSSLIKKLYIFSWFLYFLYCQLFIIVWGQSSKTASEDSMDSVHNNVILILCWHIRSSKLDGFKIVNHRKPYFFTMDCQHCWVRVCYLRWSKHHTQAHLNAFISFINLVGYCYRTSVDPIHFIWNCINLVNPLQFLLSLLQLQ